MKNSYYSPEKTSLYFSPRKLIFGIGTSNSVGQEAKKLGATKALIITDKNLLAAGQANVISASLKAEGIDVEIFAEVQAEPPARNVDEAAHTARKLQCDIVLGVGGGSCMDVAKGASLMARIGGRVLDYAGTDLVPERGLPKILMPTTAGTGSEVTRVFVVTDESDHLKKAIYSDYVLADAAIVDPGLTVSMPCTVTVDTGIDALIHAIETYVSVNCTPFSDILAIEAIRLCAENLPIAFAKSTNMEARFNMSLAATLAGVAFASGGLGANHALAYVLGTDYHLSHGRSNAVLMPHIVDFNRIASPERYARIAEALGLGVGGLSDDEAGERLVQYLKHLLELLHVAPRLKEYGVTEGSVPSLVEGALKQSRLFVPNPRNLTAEDIAEIYRCAL